jgi:hypothetical protein
VSNLPGTSALLNPPAVPEPSVGFQRPAALITYAEGQVPPPSALYVGLNDLIELKTWCDAGSGCTYILDIRLLLADGTIQIQQESVVNTGGRATTINQFRLAEGFLLSVAVRTLNLAVVRGAAFAAVSILRTIAPNNTLTLSLTKGYVTFFGPVAWPITSADFPGNRPGQIFISGIGNPAAGVDWTVTIPASVRWRIMGIVAVLATSAVAGNRQVILQLTQAGATACKSAAVPTQIASTVVSYNYGAGITTLLTQIGTGTLNVQTAIPVDYWLPAAQTFSVVTQGLLAGDQWSSINFIVEESLDQ